MLSLGMSASGPVLNLRQIAYTVGEMIDAGFRSRATPMGCLRRAQRRVTKIKE